MSGALVNVSVSFRILRIPVLIEEMTSAHCTFCPRGTAFLGLPVLFIGMWPEMSIPLSGGSI